MPSITSIPFCPSTINSAGNVTPQISIGISRQVRCAVTLDPGICTLMTLVKSSALIPLIFTNDSITNECDAPESNKTWAGTKLTENVPKMTSPASWASSACSDADVPWRCGMHRAGHCCGWGSLWMVLEHWGVEQHSSCRGTLSNSGPSDHILNR